MTKSPRLWHILVLAIALFGLTYVGVGRGWFRGMYFIDMPLHVIGGVIIALFWWWITSRFKITLGRLIGTLASFVGFSAIVNLLWEAYEYITWEYFAEVTPRWELFAPTVSDVLLDLSLAILGSLLVAIVYCLYRRKLEKLNSVAS